MALSYTQASQVKKETPVQTTKISAPTLNTYQQSTAAPVVSTPVLNSVQPAIVNRPPTDDLAYQSVLGGNNYLAKKAESDAAAAAEAQRVAAAQAASKKPTDDLAYQSLVSGNNYLAKKEESDYRGKVTNAGIDILNYTLPQNSYVRNTLDRSSAEIALGRLSYMAEKEEKEAEEAEKSRQEAAQNKNFFQKAWTTIGAGAGQFDSSVAQFVNMAATGVETAEAWLNGGFTSAGKFVKGEAPFTGSLFQPIHDWANWTTSTANKLSEENQLQAKTAAGKTANEIAAGVIAAAPQAVLALMTMGGSTAGTLATQSAGMTNSVNAALSRLSSNPSYWASFVQEAGGNFAEAKANGATDEQAITAATISGLANAMIEVGGGIEDNAWLNDDTLTKLQKAGKLAGSAFGEGKEELIQNPITRATQKLVYDKDKAWFSLTDEDAVINPKASAKEFAMGTAVGGILSGANFAINAGVNAANKANIRNAANSGVQSSLDEAIMQTLTAPQSENMTAAEKVSYIENVKKTANQQTLTEKALGINENQTDNRTTQQNLPQNPISQAQSVITAPQTIEENTQENTASNANLDEAIMSALKPANAQAEKNAAPIAEADSTVINDDPDVHTEQEQRIIEEYKNSAYMNKEGASHSVDTDNLSRRNGATVSENAPGNNVAQESKNVNAAADNDLGAKRSEFQSEPKQSQTQWNTIGAIESQNDVPADVQEPIFYDTISEQQSMANARSRLEQDYAGEMAELRSKTNWQGEEVDMGMTILDNYRREAEATGDWSKYAEWRKVVSAHGTAAGQALQAYAKYSRQTGGGLVAEATAALDNAKKGTDKNKVMNEVNNLAQEYDAAREGANGDTDIDGLLNVIRKASEIRKTSSAKNGKIKGLEWAIERVANLARAEVESGENGDYVEFLRAFAANSIYNIAADTNKTSVGEALKTIRRQAMLSKVSTTMRNLVSNNVFDPVDSVSRNMSVPLDMLISKITGTRSVAVDASWLSKAKRTGSLNGLARACMEVGLDVSVSAEGKYENTANRTFKMSGGIFSKVMSVWEAIEGYALNATDEFQKGGIEASVQEGIDRLYEQGKITKRDNRTKKTVKRIVDKSLQNAGEQEALYRTFQDDTAISKIATWGRSVLNEAGRAAAERLGFNPSEDGLGVGDVILPFAQVPSNLAARAIEYSPAGLIKSTVSLVNVLKAAKQGTLTAAQQAQAVQGIGRGINGTAMIAIAAAGALRGWLNVAGDDDDKNKAGMEKGQGLTGTQLNLDAALRDLKGEGAEWRDGDTLLSIGFLDPMNAQLTTGALLADDIRDADGETLKDRLGSVGFGRIFGDSLSGAIQSVLDTPMMSQFASIADSIKYSKAETAAGKAVDAVKQFAAGIPSSFIPNALTGIAQGTDSVERNAYSSDSIGQQTIDSIKASIPGLRQTLPAKQDSWGNDVTNEGGIQNFLNRNINPGTVTKYKTNEIETELERISEATGESLFPQKSAPYSVSFTKDGEKQNVKLDYEQRTAYQKAYGDAYASAVSDLLGSKNYNDMPDEMKAEILNKAENIATNKAKDSLGIGFTMSDDDRAVYDAEAKEKVDSLIVSAIGSKKYLSDDLKSGYDTAKTAISSIDGLPEEVRKAASDKAQEYFLAVEKSKYGKDLEKSQAELANLSDEELANYFISKSVESSEYLSEEGIKANNIVQKNIGNNFGLSDELMSKANEKAQNYYVALERAKYGTELSGTYKELDGLSYRELADYFVNKAVKDRYTDENKSGSNWDELSDALQKNEIDDATVFAVLPEEQTIAYDRWGKTAGVSAQQWLDALSFHNSEAGKTEYDDDDVEIVSAKDKLQNYIDGQSGMSQEQKDAIMRGFYNDNPATYKYLVSAINSGEITPEAAKKELTPSQQSGWSHNVKQTGASMANYISAVDTYIEAPTEDERKKLGYKSKWEWYVDELNKTGLNQQQKYAIFISMNGSISDKNKAVAYGKLK